MDIQQLRCFVEVAEHLNFTAAAKHLYIGQPALSRSISELESEVGTKLFFRSSRSVKLTTSGKVFLNYANLILAKYAEAIEMARQADLGHVGSLNIGCLGTERYFLPRIINQFLQHNSTIDLNINRFSWGEVNEALDHDDIDIAFTFSIGLEQLSRVACLQLSKVPLTAVLPADNRLAGEALIRLSDLANEPFILPSQKVSPLSYEYSLKLCLKNGFMPNIISQPPLIETILMKVEARLGVSILSGNVSASSSSELRFIPIDDPDAHIDMVVAYKTDNHNPLIPLFLKEVEQHLRAQDQPQDPDV